MTMPDNAAMVVLVEDDVSVREALQSLVESIGLACQAFGSVQDYLAAPRPQIPHCLILDVRLPGRSGLDLQADLTRDLQAPPIIFLTGHGDIPMSVRAMKAGAIEFLVKPVRDQDLIDAIFQGIEKDRQRRAAQGDQDSLRARVQTLTPREREVVLQVAKGLLNKQIAADLGLSEITVKVHRGNALRKLGTRSVADLVRMVDALGLTQRKR